MAELKVEIANLTRLLEQGAAGELRLCCGGARHRAGMQQQHCLAGGRQERALRSGALWMSQLGVCSRRTAALPCCPAVGLVEEKDLNELIRQNEELTRERDAQVEQIVALRNEVRWGRGSRGGRCVRVVVAWRLCASGNTRKKAARNAVTARPYVRACGSASPHLSLVPLYTILPQSSVCGSLGHRGGR